MKILTLNFLTCAVRNCKSSAAAFPLHVRDAELEIVEIEFQPDFIRNVLPRLDVEALKSVAGELGLSMPDVRNDIASTDIKADVEMADEPALETSQGQQLDQKVAEDKTDSLQKLHRLLLETQIDKGLLVCGNCGHEYKIMEGIPNFLLPPHLV